MEKVSFTKKKKTQKKHTHTHMKMDYKYRDAFLIDISDIDGLYRDIAVISFYHV